MAVHVGGRGPGHLARVRGTAPPYDFDYLTDETPDFLTDELSDRLIGQTGSALVGSPTIKALAAARGIRFGAAISATSAADSAARAQLQAQCAIYVADSVFKPSSVQNTEGVFDFSGADTFLSQVAADGKPWRLHLLSYPAHDMAWVTTSTVTSANWKVKIDAHLEAIATHIGSNLPTSIDVTNENIHGNSTTNSGYNSTPWFTAAAATPYTVPGYSALAEAGGTYVTYLFKKARSLWPTVPLYWCHDQIEMQTDGYGQLLASNFQAALAAQLTAGAPIDGVNLQGHLTLAKGFDPKRFRDSLQAIQALGLKIIVGEHDIHTGSVGIYSAIVALGYTNAELDRQVADLSRQYLGIVLPFVSGGEFLTWGLSDRFNAWGGAERPLLYDSSDVLKAQYAANMKEAFAYDR